MSYSTVYLFSCSILVLILVCANVIFGNPQPTTVPSLSSKALELFKTSKCGGLANVSKFEKYIDECKGVDPEKVKFPADLGPDLCLGVVNNIIAFCDRELFKELNDVFEKSEEKFKNLGAKENICPLETLELKPFLSDNNHFNELRLQLKNQLLCNSFCYDLHNKTRDECSLWHKTNTILTNFKNQTDSNSTVKLKSVNSNAASHVNKPTTTQDLKINNVSQESTVPKPGDIKTNVINQTQNSTKKEDESLSTIELPPGKGENKIGNKSLVTNKEISGVTNPKKAPNVDKTKNVEEEDAQGNKPESEPQPPAAVNDAQPESDRKKTEDGEDDLEVEPNAGQVSDTKDNFGINGGGLNDSELDDDNTEIYLNNFDKSSNKKNIHNPLQNEEEDKSINLQTAGTIKLEEGFYNSFDSAPDSHFFYYFLFSAGLVILGYVVFHNKNKILAYALEGKRSRNSRRRPNSASYRKLDCSLEEAITSNSPHSSVTNVVY